MLSAYGVRVFISQHSVCVAFRLTAGVMLYSVPLAEAQ